MLTLTFQLTTLGILQIFALQKEKKTAIPRYSFGLAVPLSSPTIDNSHTVFSNIWISEWCLKKQL